MSRPHRHNEQKHIPLYAWISFGTFICCLVVFLLLITNVEKLASFSLVERSYYIVLVLMGLASAVFLFGVIPSSAGYQGHMFGGKLRLGGAIVGAAIVVVGGHFFAPQASTFPLTVYVHGPAGLQDKVLRNSGSVVLELGPETKSATIEDNGQAYFPAVPSTFHGLQVPAWVDSRTYELADSKMGLRLDGTVLYLEVKIKLNHYRLAGTISDDVGNPIFGVRVALPEYRVEQQTNGDGRFELEVVASSQQIVDIVAQKPGYEIKHLSATLGDTGVKFSLQRGK
jgi:hypothetical protein